MRCVLLALATACAAPDTPQLTIRRPADDNGAISVRLAPATLRAIAPDRLAQTIRVFVAGVEDAPRVLGELERQGEAIRFVPRYPLSEGVAYRVEFDGRELPASADPRDRVQRTATLELAVQQRDPTASVAAIYPSADVLPENLLRFYVHFSEPMSQGRAYDYVRLLDTNGAVVELAFLEIGEELWDREGKRLTLLFDPGRIKRGLLPRRLEGPALHEGRRFTLEVDANWPDANGTPLVRGLRKSFRVSAADTTQPSPAKWRLTAPPAGCRKPLIVDLAEPLDHALLQRMIWLIDADGNELETRLAVQRGETRLSWTPDEDWQAGEYRLVIDTSLEDRAGNSIRAPFEVDVVRKGTKRIVPETQSLRFSIHPE